MKTTAAQICSSMALIFVCVSMFASLGLATDDKKCLSSLQDKCVDQIFQSYSTGTIQPLDAACCEGIFTVNKECWSQMFPNDPSFPDLLQAYCNLHGSAIKRPPPPSPSKPPKIPIKRPPPPSPSKPPTIAIKRPPPPSPSKPPKIPIKRPPPPSPSKPPTIAIKRPPPPSPSKPTI